jgi:hypothetical protein
MKAVWLGVAFLLLAVATRLTHLGEEQALTYRPNEAVTYAISFNAIIFWLCLAMAALLGVLTAVEQVRAR